MTIRATAGLNFVRYDPGNPEFPTLPDGVIVPHVLDYQTGGGDKRTRQAYSSRTKFIAASAPANDSQRYAGWQTETTWINPTVVDFGVIPTPVQRTVSLYNARTVSIEVTALSLPTGVTLLSPSLPITLLPYDGANFIIEAGVTGENTFDEASTFTTSVGDSLFRTLGRRVFTLNVFPQAPMSETLQFRTDLLRSTDGTEKAYSLLQAPNIHVDYRVFFTNDLERIRFKNRFIAGESALTVAGQKWYEARLLGDAAQSTDTSLLLNTSSFNSSWNPGPISLVTEAGDVTEAVLDSTEGYPDPDITFNSLVLRFDGVDGTQTTGDSGPQNHGDLTWLPDGNMSISTTQSKWGGSSYFGGTSFPSFTTQGATINDYDYFGSSDWQIDMWIYPTNLLGCPLSRYYSTFGHEYRIQMEPTRIIFRVSSPAVDHYFTYGSPTEVQLNQWSYLTISRSGTDLRMFINGVQLVGIARNTVDFTPPTAAHPIEEDQQLQLNLSGEIGTVIPAGSRVMPVGLGYVSRFPTYSTYQDNLEVADYTLTFNQEADFGALDASFPTLSNALLSPVVETPILEACNEISGRVKRSQLQRYEDSLESGLSNRQAFTVFPFADTTQEYMITLNSEDEVWKWRAFIHYLRGSYNDFYVPTFTDDIPGVTTAASNTFVAQDTDLALLFGTTPADRRNAVRFEYPDGTIMYRIITAVVDNGATEQITVSSAVNAGNPKISYLQRARILGDTVSFTHNRTDYVTLRFRYRTLTA
jgi:hypothetical protein